MMGVYRSEGKKCVLLLLLSAVWFIHSSFQLLVSGSSFLAAMPRPLGKLQLPYFSFLFVFFDFIFTIIQSTTTTVKPIYAYYLCFMERCNGKKITHPKSSSKKSAAKVIGESREWGKGTNNNTSHRNGFISSHTFTSMAHRRKQIKTR